MWMVPESPISNSGHKQLARTLPTLKVDTVHGNSSTVGIVQFGQKCKINNKNLNVQLILPPQILCCWSQVLMWVFYLVMIFQGTFHTRTQ